MAQLLKPVVVFSGVNLTEAGPLAVMKDAVHSFIKSYLDKYQLILLVNNKELFKELEGEDIIIMEFPAPKKRWFLRLWFEYIQCYFISKKLKPHLWFALHDMTPNVSAKVKAVYCHNVIPFYELSWKEAKAQKKLFLFNVFYKYLYGVNIKANNFVVVQQDWIREKFKKSFKINNVIVAYPDIHLPNKSFLKEPQQDTFTFFYPSFPRIFKNFEVVCEAAFLLSKRRNNFKVKLTIDGSENNYSMDLVKKYHEVECIEFMGLKSREDVWRTYNNSDCLVFPSKLESWGLPISEMKFFGKPILVANIKYACETIGDYPKAKFFEAENSLQLSNYMEELMEGRLKFDLNDFKEPDQPFVKGWAELLQVLLN